MRLLSRLEYERSFAASWVTYFVRIPNLYFMLHYFASALAEPTIRINHTFCPPPYSEIPLMLDN
jgi:hypothetical protein